MRQKRLKLSAVLLLGLGLTSLQAQTMYVKESSGTQTAYTLSNVRKMTFSGGNATVQKTDNSIVAFALIGLRYLNFSAITTSITEQPMPIANATLITYPNPVTDVLTIDLTGVATGGTISILTLEGKLLQTQQSNGTNTVTINMSQLPKGIYICRCANTTEIKTVKIIKQ